MHEHRQYLDISKARTAEQKEQMVQIIAEGICPFCPEHLATYHSEPIISETPYWLVTPNQHPYEFTQEHLLLIARRHVEHIRELTKAEWQDLGKLATSLTSSMEFGGFGARFGDINRTAASVAHLHFHIIQPLDDLAPDQTVRFKIST